MFVGEFLITGQKLMSQKLSELANHLCFFKINMVMDYLDWEKII